jgi:phage recombination protein Bet
MSLAIQTQSSKIVHFELGGEKVQLLKDMFFRDSTDTEFQIFVHACQRTGLDPFMRQIHPVKRGGKMTIQTGIDGFRLIAERTGRYSPGKEATFTCDEQGKLQSATAYIKKQTPDGSWHEISATAYWDEYVQVYNGKPSQFWAKMPRTMLAKVAETIALRKAFPADLSGIYSNEEMNQADNIETVSATIVSQIEEKKESPELTFEELDEYLEKNYGGKKDEFRRFMNEIMENKKWTYKKCIEVFEKHKEHTHETFMKWLDKSTVKAE